MERGHLHRIALDAVRCDTDLTDARGFFQKNLRKSAQSIKSVFHYL